MAEHMCFKCGTFDPHAEPDPCCDAPKIRIAVFVVASIASGKMEVCGVYPTASAACNSCDEENGAVGVFPFGFDQTEERTFRMWAADGAGWRWVTA